MIDFFVIGAARCGTTSLFRVLKQHPNVYTPSVKEPRFFYRNWARGFDWYRSLYAQKSESQIAGDFSPDYSISTGSNKVPCRIARYYPKAKIVYVVRHPVEASLSNWQMTAELRSESLSFRQALEDPVWSITVLERVRYFKQISLYREFFPDNQIRVVALESIRSDVEAVAELFQFLGIPAIEVPFFPRANASRRKPGRPEKPYVPGNDRRFFIELLQEDANSILEYCGLPTDFWNLSARWPDRDPVSSTSL